MTSQSNTQREYSPSLGGKILKLEVTGSTDDTTTISLGSTGMSSFEGITGFVHEVSGSSAKPLAPETSLSGDVLTITMSTTNNGKAEAAYNSKKHVFFVYGESN